MQIISPGDNLHEMSMPIFWKRKISSICHLLNLPIEWYTKYKHTKYNLREKAKYIHELQTEKNA